MYTVEGGIVSINPGPHLLNLWREDDMGKESLGQMIKRIIGGLVWVLFIWSLDMTQEQYWKQIYEQEKIMEAHQ